MPAIDQFDRRQKLVSNGLVTINPRRTICPDRISSGIPKPEVRPWAGSWIGFMVELGFESRNNTLQTRRMTFLG